MQNKRIFSGAIICAIMMIALLLVPTLALNASAAGADTWQLVTDAATLKADDQIVIVAKDSNYALSTTQSKNNRGQAAVTKSGSAVTFGNDVQILTLEDGTTAGTFAFNTGSGYLYAASSGSNHLKTKTTKDANASWKITIAANGTTTIVAQGSNTRNTMQYNQQSSLFACYSSASQNAILIYKLEVGATTDPEEPICEHTNTTTTTTDATCTEKGSTKVTCNDCGAVSSVEIPATGHNYVDGVCKGCGIKETNYSGRYFIATIRTSGNYFYMTSNLGTSGTKRYQAVDSKSTTLPESVKKEDGYVFVLERNTDDTYCIYAEGVKGDNYLGWTGSNSGTLVAKNNALKLTIDIKDDSTFNIHFKSSDGERYLSLNNSATNNYFAWYSSAQRQDLSLIPVSEPKLAGAQVNLGESLAIKYHVSLPGGFDASLLKLVVTNAHGTVTEIKDYTVIDGKYVFTYAGIAPQCMSDNISAVLYSGDEVVDSKTEYSVVENAKALAEKYPENTKLRQLLADLLAYGKASQAHLGDKHNVSFVTDDDIKAVGTAGAAAPEASINNTHRVVGTPEDNTLYISGVGVRFENTVKIYVVLAGDVTNAKAVVNETEYRIVTVGENKVAYLADMKASELSSPIEIKLYNGETLQHTVTYGVYSYVYQMMQKAQTNPTMAALAHALYNYAESAKAYFK